MSLTVHIYKNIGETKESYEGMIFSLFFLFFFCCAMF